MYKQREMTVVEAAHYFDVSPETIRRAKSLGLIHPVDKLARPQKFRLGELQQWRDRVNEDR